MGHTFLKIFLAIFLVALSYTVTRNATVQVTVTRNVIVTRNATVQVTVTRNVIVT